jgi:hypothetical protein
MSEHPGLEIGHLRDKADDNRLLKISLDFSEGFL